MHIDYHCHTTASDGSLTPRALLDLARQNSVTSLAITDHDTLDAYQQLPDQPDGIELIAGIELSTLWRKTGIHIVGLNVDRFSPAMAMAVASQRAAREQRARDIAAKLEHYGLSNPLAGAQVYAGDGAIGRPHFAMHMVATGFVRNEREAFKRYLGSGKPCDIKQCWAAPEQIVAWIKGAGGIAVLAHPGKYDLTRTKLVTLLDDFKAWGGEAIEVISGQQIPNVTRDLASLCRQFELRASWGSDFHHPGQPWAQLGRYSTPPQDLKPVWQLWQ